MGFYTAVLRRSGGSWVALCLGNGVVGQGETKQKTLLKLKEAIGSLADAIRDDPEICSGPVSLKELHEFLQVEGEEAFEEPFEMRAPELDFVFQGRSFAGA